MENVLTKYLQPSEAIDFNNSMVLQKAEELAFHSADTVDTAKRCYEFVRDEIHHHVDYDMNPVTYKASEVLTYKTGFCFSKSHLLAALLRANSIPAGLCYQRITCNAFDQTYCLHGLTAVYLHKFGWYRIDPRGNKEGISARFDPPIKKLAYNNELPGEYLFPEIWAEPLSPITEFLTTYTDYKEALKNLPDVALIDRND